MLLMNNTLTNLTDADSAVTNPDSRLHGAMGCVWDLEKWEWVNPWALCVGAIVEYRKSIGDAFTNVPQPQEWQFT